MLGVKSEEAGLSRRDFLFGIAIAGAVAVPMLSEPARAAVSMLRSGLDPDLVEGESEVIPVGKRGGVDAVGMVGAAEVMAADTEAAEAEVMVVDTEAVEVMAAATAVTGAAAVVGTVVVAAGGAVAGMVGAGPAGFGGRLLAGFGLARDTGQVLPSFPETR
jgi:hypothetical protein